MRWLLLRNPEQDTGVGGGGRRSGPSSCFLPLGRQAQLGGLGMGGALPWRGEGVGRADGPVQ